MNKRAELIQTIKDIENGLAVNPTGEILERLTSRLARAKSKLAELDEKKSDPQPTEKPEQLPDPEQRREQENKAAFFKEKRQAAQLHPESRPQERQPGLLEQVINLVAPPAALEQVIEIEIDGVVESYGLEELRDKARTWFTQTAEGAAIQGKGKLENSVQFRRLCAVVPNWEQFYGYKPKVQDLHRRHNLHGEAVKSAAVRLLQILTK